MISLTQFNLYTFFSKSIFPSWFLMKLWEYYSIKANIIWTPPRGGEGSKFWLPSSKGRNLKNLKSGWKYGAGVSLFKRGEGVEGLHFSYLFFSRFIISTFRNYFTLCKIVLRIWRKTSFFCQHNFIKKGHSKLSNNEPENIP